jgi:DNA-binding PadR family transcriptional regulator
VRKLAYIGDSLNENVLNDNMDSMDSILQNSFIESRHMLFLYTQGVNRDLIQASFFSMAKKGETMIYISNQDIKSAKTRFEKLNLFPLIMQPKEIKNFLDGMNKYRSFRIISEGILEHQEIHELLNLNKNNTLLCMYELRTLKLEQLNKIVKLHEKMVLNTPNMTILSANSFKGLNIDYFKIERFVKEYLDIIVLSLIASKPMCGIEILDVIHREFNVLLSPGTIYPLLHKLRAEGLLEREYIIKKKIYRVAKGNEKNISNILDEHLIANEFLNEFLKSTALGGMQSEQKQ